MVPRSRAAADERGLPHAARARDAAVTQRVVARSFSDDHAADTRRSIGHPGSGPQNDRRDEAARRCRHRHFTFVDDIISPARFNNLSKAILEDVRRRPIDMRATLSIRYRRADPAARFFRRAVSTGDSRLSSPRGWRSPRVEPFATLAPCACRALGLAELRHEREQKISRSTDVNLPSMPPQPSLMEHLFCLVDVAEKSVGD